MTKENCPNFGRPCMARLTLDEKYPVCKRILGSLWAASGTRVTIAASVKSMYAA